MAGYGSSLIIRRQARNSDGDRTGVPVDTRSTGWLIGPATNDESNAPGRDYTTDRLSCYRRGGLTGLDFHPNDRVYLEGDDLNKPPTWQVDGNPQWWARDGRMAGVVVTLERVQG